MVLACSSSTAAERAKKALQYGMVARSHSDRRDPVGRLSQDISS
jgi:hypothetical protein